MKKFNRAVWLKDLRETESQISALKKQIHQPHTVKRPERYPWGAGYGLVQGPDGPVRVSGLVAKLQQLTATATALYALRRQVKFKMHPVNKAWVWKEYKNYMGGMSRFVSFAYVSFATPQLPTLRQIALNKQILEHFDTSKYFDEVNPGALRDVPEEVLS